jgi:hypothetical protein
VACVVLASIAKLLPAAFLLLLFLPAFRSRANTWRAIGGAIAVAVITLAPFAAKPDYLADFLRGLTSQHPPLQFNPSLLGVVDELARNPRTAFLATGWMALVPMAAYYVLLLLVSRRLLGWAFGTGNAARTILAGVMLYALLAPRMIIYSYMIVIVPVLALLRRAVGKTRVGEYALLAAICVGGLPILPAGAGKFVSDVSPLLLLWGCWLALVALERRGQLAEA